MATEMKLKEGWFEKDVKKAAERVDEWKVANRSEQDDETPSPRSDHWESDD